MALQQNLEELSVEELASMVQGSSFDIIPSTEVAPGMAEAGAIPEASAEMLPPPAGVDKLHAAALGTCGPLRTPKWRSVDAGNN